MYDLVRRNRENGAVRPWGSFERTFEDLRREINQLFDGAPLDGMPERLTNDFAPTVDVVENPDDIRVTCNLPGVEKDQISVSVTDNVLTISGEKHEEKTEKDAQYHRRESWYGKFERSLPLPAYVDRDKIDATMKNGVLTLTLPKQEEAKQKRISVKVK